MMLMRHATAPDCPAAARIPPWPSASHSPAAAALRSREGRRRPEHSKCPTPSPSRGPPARASPPGSGRWLAQGAQPGSAADPSHPQRPLGGRCWQHATPGDLAPPPGPVRWLRRRLGGRRGGCDGRGGRHIVRPGPRRREGGAGASGSRHRGPHLRSQASGRALSAGRGDATPLLACVRMRVTFLEAVERRGVDGVRVCVPCDRRHAGVPKAQEHRVALPDDARLENSDGLGNAPQLPTVHRPQHRRGIVPRRQGDAADLQLRRPGGVLAL